MRRKDIRRKKKSLLRDIKDWTGMNVEELFYVERERKIFRYLVANIRHKIACKEEILVFQIINAFF